MGTAWSFLRNLKTEPPYDPAVPLLSRYPKEHRNLHPTVHSNVRGICRSAAAQVKKGHKGFVPVVQHRRFQMHPIISAFPSAFICRYFSIIPVSAFYRLSLSFWSLSPHSHGYFVYLHGLMGIGGCVIMTAAVV